MSSNATQRANALREYWRTKANQRWYPNPSYQAGKAKAGEYVDMLDLHDLAAAEARARQMGVGSSRAHAALLPTMLTEGYTIAHNQEMPKSKLYDRLYNDMGFPYQYVKDDRLKSGGYYTYDQTSSQNRAKAMASVMAMKEKLNPNTFTETWNGKGTVRDKYGNVQVSSSNHQNKFALAQEALTKPENQGLVSTYNRLVQDNMRYGPMQMMKAGPTEYIEPTEEETPSLLQQIRTKVRNFTGGY